MFVRSMSNSIDKLYDRSISHYAFVRISLIVTLVSVGSSRHRRTDPSKRRLHAPLFRHEFIVLSNVVTGLKFSISLFTAF